MSERLEALRRGGDEREGETLRLGVGKGREVESLGKGEREREREKEEGVQHYSVSTYVCCHFIHSESTPGGLILTALIVAFNCILCLCTQPNPEPSHMTVLIVYCDLCT